MIAGPNSPPRVMHRALYTSIIALEVAGEVDIDRTADDIAFFEAEKLKLQPLAQKLETAINAHNAFKTYEERRLQLRVELGDQVQDRGVRDGNTRTKLGVKGKQGLDATHVFGTKVDELVKEKISVEPKKVLEAVSKLDQLPAFGERDAIKQDLSIRAEQQQKFLDEREAGALKGTMLFAEAVAAVVDGALALARLKGLLDARFPRQRDYVDAFFLDVTPERKPKKISGDEGADNS